MLFRKRLWQHDISARPKTKLLLGGWDLVVAIHPAIQLGPFSTLPGPGKNDPGQLVKSIIDFTLLASLCEKRL